MRVLGLSLTLGLALGACSQPVEDTAVQGVSQSTAATTTASPVQPPATEEPVPSPGPELTVQPGPAPDPGAPFNIRLQHMGIHSYTMKPGAGTGSIRLACAPTWRDTNPRRGVYDWEDFDFWIERVESWGYSDILVAFCGTPSWAAGKESVPATPVLGAKSTAPPKKMQDWKRFVSAVASRYGDRISHYEVWNEASSPQFYSGTPDEMAQMTKLAHTAIKTNSPGATVVSASTQTHKANYYAAFFPPYLKSLGTRNWPIDVVAVHGYPETQTSPAARVEGLEKAREDIRLAQAPENLEMWDTEVNYEAGVPKPKDAKQRGRVWGDKAAAWTAQTYLDSWRLGLRRTYWYLWTDAYYSFPGIQMRTGDPAARSLKQLSGWVVNSRFAGCASSSNLHVCDFKRNGEKWKIAWTSKGSETLPLARKKQICNVYPGTCITAKKASITQMPVRIA